MLCETIAFIIYIIIAFIDIFEQHVTMTAIPILDCLGHSEIPGAMSTDMAGASLLTYKPMSQVSHEEKMESYTLCFTVWVESLVN